MTEDRRQMTEDRGQIVVCRYAARYIQERGIAATKPLSSVLCPLSSVICPLMP
ncbi:MAG: hypothetical protein HY936_06260 [Nitrosomonadales bacterium]|nr:hypothetical protein [Nitrosomonadales bacterium]